MKNYIFLCLFLAFSSLSAQSVYIPDVNFKNRLIALGVDTNVDGNIQQSEALAVTNLDVSNDSISDLAGIEAFVNLDTLDCSYNFLANLDVNPLTNLQYLCCATNQIQNLDVINSTNLQFLSCQHNQIQNLDVSNLTNLQYLWCGFNQIQNLDVTPLINLQNLEYVSNQIQNLDVSTLINLQYLQCSFNQIQNLDVAPLINLLGLDCSSNQLQNIDVSTLINLEWLYCGHNQLQNLDVSALTNLQTFICSYNLIQSLDINASPNLWLLGCENNQLNTLFIKNGSEESTLHFQNNPNLQYICADTSQIAIVTQKTIQYGMNNVVINSFCSYTLGGNYNSILGKSIYDENMNGCTLTDSAYPFLIINVTDGINIGYTYSNWAGICTTFLDSGTYTFTPQLQNPTYFSANPISSNVYFPNDSNNVQTQDFCIIPNGIFPDVEIVIVPTSEANPGFDATYQLLFHNKGTTTVSGDIILNFMGNKMNFLNANISPTNQTANQLTWNYSNLQLFETRSIIFTMHLLQPPINNMGDEIGFGSYIPLANDVYPNDNHSDLKQTFVSSWDPNDKTCLEGNLINNSQIGDYLHYLIRFQNTGNFPADHVVVVDSINTNQFDISTIQILETSHNAHISIENNSLQFYFENIMLADSFTNEPASHGYVLFKIKTKSNLPLNSSVSNKAEIYFDYNLPVVTNTEITTFANIVSVGSAIQKPQLKCYPNPAQNSLTIETEKPTDFVILNVLGETVISKHIEGKQAVDISMLPKGIYFIQEKSTNLGELFVKE